MPQKKKTLYIGVQEGNLALLDERFDEAMFRKVASDMLMMHKVDLSMINKNDYIMELY